MQFNNRLQTLTINMDINYETKCFFKNILDSELSEECINLRMMIFIINIFFFCVPVNTISIDKILWFSKIGCFMENGSI